MPSFGKVSADRLATADKRLQDVFNEVIKHFDCTIACGIRTKEEQDAAVAAVIARLRGPRVSITLILLRLWMPIRTQ